MRSPGINGEGELRGQPANPGSPGKWPLKQRVCVCVWLDDRKGIWPVKSWVLVMVILPELYMSWFQLSLHLRHH